MGGQRKRSDVDVQTRRWLGAVAGGQVEIRVPQHRSDPEVAGRTRECRPE